QRTHQSHAACDQLRRHSGAAAAGPDRLGRAADRRQIGLHGVAQPDRGGSSLVAGLSGAGHQVITLVRNPAKAEMLPPPITLITSLDQLPADARIDVIVNLAGEPIGNGLWTEAKRGKILDSRINMTGDIVKLIARLERKPAVLVSGSAIGWYGLWQDQVLTESAKSHACFSHELCDAWESAARPAEAHGVRVVCLRIGLVIGTDGGFITRMLTPFEFGLGGPLGSGR